MNEQKQSNRWIWGLAIFVLIAFCFGCWIYLRWSAAIPQGVFETFIPSPSFDERPGGMEVDTIVIHASEVDSLTAVIWRFTRKRSKVSAHYTIAKDGRVVQHVSEFKRAWHAGESLMLDGRTKVNDFSIGIELVNKNDGTDPYPDAQLVELRRILKGVISRHPIRFIVSHAEIAQPPGRKTDPDGFDFSSLRELCNSSLKSSLEYIAGPCG